MKNNSKQQGTDALMTWLAATKSPEQLNALAADAKERQLEGTYTPRPGNVVKIDYSHETRTGFLHRTIA